MLKVRNKAIRITLRVLLGFCLLVILLFAGLSIYIETNKESLLNKVRKGISENVRGDIQYSKADITIWRNFPFVGLRLYDVNLQDSVYKMPFFKMKEVKAEVSLFQVFRKNIELRNIELSNGVIHVFTDTSGYTNKYLSDLKKKQDTSIKRGVLVNHVGLHNVQLILENRKRNKLFDFNFKNLEADIETTGNRMRIDLENDAVVNSMAFSLSRGSYLRSQPVKMDISVNYDTDSALLDFNEQSFRINDQKYLIAGKFLLRGDGFFDLKVNTKNADYQKLKMLLSDNISAKLSKFNLEKPIDVQADIHGPLGYKTTPKVLVNWQVKNNKLVTEFAEFSNCSFDGNFVNEKIKGAGFTDENSEILLKQFSGNWDGIQLNGKNISVTNLIDPYLNFSLASSLDFKTLNNKLALRTISFLEGNASLYLSYSGPITKDISVVDKLNGRLSFSNGTIKYIPRSFTFRNCSGNVLFSDNNINVQNLKCDLGKSQFIINVAGNNLSGLSSSDASKASIACNLYCPVLDVAELKGLFAGKKRVATQQNRSNKLIKTAAGVDDVMDNGNLSVALNVNKLQYKKFIGENLKGNIIFSNNDLSIKNISLNHANGRMEVNGEIRQSQNSNAATAKVYLQNVDVKKVFYSFDNFGQDGIESSNIQGVLNTTANISLAFDDNGITVPGSTKGTIDFSLKNGALINYEPLQDIKQSIFKNKDMSHISFAELKNRFDVDGFKIKINKMEIQSSAIGMFVDGIYDIRKDNTKINIQVPLKGLKQRDSTYIPQNVGVDAKKGFSVYLEGKTDKKTGKVKFSLNATKTIRKIF